MYSNSCIMELYSPNFPLVYRFSDLDLTANKIFRLYVKGSSDPDAESRPPKG